MASIFKCIYMKCKNEIRMLLVTWSCCNKLPWTTWLKQQTFILHTSGDLESEVSAPASWAVVKVLFMAYWCPLVSWQGRETERTQESKQAVWSLHIRAVIPRFHRAPPNLSTTQRLHPSIPSHWGLEFQHTKSVGGYKHLVHNNNTSKLR